MDKYTAGALSFMGWEKQDLEQSWKSFKQHVHFMSDSTLKRKKKKNAGWKKPISDFGSSVMVYFVIVRL